MTDNNKLLNDLNSSKQLIIDLINTEYDKLVCQYSKNTNFYVFDAMALRAKIDERRTEINKLNLKNKSFEMARKELTTNIFEGIKKDISNSGLPLKVNLINYTIQITTIVQLYINEYVTIHIDFKKIITPYGVEYVGLYYYDNSDVEYDTIDDFFMSPKIIEKLKRMSTEAFNNIEKMNSKPQC